RWKLQTAMGTDLTPSMHWPAPITVQDIEHDRGPVLVTVEYRIRPQGDGAYRWGLYEDAAESGRILEIFLVESWMEHLRQHERVTNADRLVQEAVHKFSLEGEPKVTHFIAADT